MCATMWVYLQRCMFVMRHSMMCVICARTRITLSSWQFFGHLYKILQCMQLILECTLCAQYTVFYHPVRQLSFNSDGFLFCCSFSFVQLKAICNAKLNSFYFHLSFLTCMQQTCLLLLLCILILAPIHKK